MKNTIRLITLDLDNTLWPVDDVIANAEKALIAHVMEKHPHANRHFTPQHLLSIRQQIIKQTPGIVHNLSQLRRQVLAEVFNLAGYDLAEAKSHADIAFEVFYQMRNRVTFFPGAIKLLETLAQDHLIIGLSNGNANLKMIGIDHYFNQHHSAESIGKPKPHPDLFQAAIESASCIEGYRVQPAMALHIGDHPEQDVDAARKFGMNTLWVNLLDGQWPDAIERTVEANSLEEVPDKIKQIKASF